MAAKSWTKAASGGDATVSAFGRTIEQETLQTFYHASHVGVGADGGIGTDTTTAIPQRVGNLTVDIFDGRTKQLVWRGQASGALSSKPEKNEGKLERSIEDMFKHFPPPAKGYLDWWGRRSGFVVWPSFPTVILRGMDTTRRDIAFLLPALLAASAEAQNSKLPSKAFSFDNLAAKPNGAKGENRQRPIMNGLTHSGLYLEVHETDLAPGSQPHPPHRHVHEEMFAVVEGTVDFTVNGESTRLGPGSVGYAASGDEHGLRNNSGSPCRYVVIAIGRDNQ